MSFLTRSLLNFASQTGKRIITNANNNRITSSYLLKYYATSSENQLDTKVKERLDSMVKKKPVVIFMKGTPAQPRCGFSRAVVEVFRMHDVQYDSYNVLEDEELRNSIKLYSNWPTIPQVYFNGEFVGGCDILLDMHRTGDLITELEKIGIKSKLEEAGDSKGSDDKNKK